MTPGTDPATWPCWACGKTFAQHADALPASGVRPRMPCLGVKAWFSPELPAASPSPAEGPSAVKPYLRAQIQELEAELSECCAQLQVFRDAGKAAELRIVELRATIARVESAAARVLFAWSDYTSQEMYGEHLRDGMDKADFDAWASAHDELRATLRGES